MSGLIKSFACAINGLLYVFKREFNIKVHIIIGIIIVLLSLFLGLSRMEMVAITFAIGLVIVAEMINTSLEGMLDFLYKREEDSRIGILKDIAAGAVLVSSIVAVIIGSLILYPHLVESFP